VQPSRRKLIKSAALAAGIAIVSWAARGQAKASKQAMQYQDQPKGDQTCDTCAQWIPGPTPDAPGECKVVEGPINPKGWCVAYVKKT
jgi:anaerobic selenocysteine-containing dehydrogenase